MAKSKYKPLKGHENVFIESNRNNADYAAVLRERSDGDWDFVALFALEEPQFPMLSQADTLQAMTLLTTIADAIVAENDRALIIYCGDPDCPSILEATVD